MSVIDRSQDARQSVGPIGKRRRLFFLMIRRPPRSTLFPYTTLHRSGHMIASDRIHTNKLLQPGGRPHMPEAELARVDESDRSIPRRDTIRATHWQKTPFGCLDLASRNPSWQRSCATATTDRTYHRKRSDSHEQTLATRGPSTYASGLSYSRR